MARSIWKGPFVDGYMLKKADASRSTGTFRNYQNLEPRRSTLFAAIRWIDVWRSTMATSIFGECDRGNDWA